MLTPTVVVGGAVRAALVATSTYLGVLTVAAAAASRQRILGAPGLPRRYSVVGDNATLAVNKQTAAQSHADLLPLRSLA